MNISVEISKYPLDKDYGNSILNFIHRLNQHADIEVRTNSMSTQIFGSYEVVMKALQQEMRTSFEQPDTTVMVMKFVNQDLS